MNLRHHYDATDEQVREAVASLLSAGVPGDGSQPLVGVHLRPGSPWGLVGRRTELITFADAFRETADSLAREFEPDEQLSGFFVIIDTDVGMPVGCARYVAGGIDDNTSLRDLETLGTLPEAARELRRLLQSNPNAWDFTTLAVIPDYRTEHAIDHALGMTMRMFLRAAAAADVTACSMLVSEHSRALMTHTGLCYRLLSERSLTYPDGLQFFPAWMELEGISDAMLSRLASMRTQSDTDPTVVRSFPAYEAMMRGTALGVGYDEFIDLTPR